MDDSSAVGMFLLMVMGFWCLGVVLAVVIGVLVWVVYQRYEDQATYTDEIELAQAQVSDINQQGREAMVADLLKRSWRDNGHVDAEWHEHE